MSQLEYLVVLVSILAGLGLADLTESLRDLVPPEMDVRWHGLPVVQAVIVVGYVLMVWWTFFRLLRTKMWHRPVAFLPILLTVLMLYLLCAFALPDADWEEASYVTTSAEGTTINMEAFYLSEAHRQWFFGTVATFSLLFFAIFSAVLRRHAFLGISGDQHAPCLPNVGCFTPPSRCTQAQMGPLDADAVLGWLDRLPAL